MKEGPTCFQGKLAEDSAFGEMLKKMGRVSDSSGLYKNAQAMVTTSCHITRCPFQVTMSVTGSPVTILTSDGSKVIRYTVERGNVDTVTQGTCLFKR